MFADKHNVTFGNQYPLVWQKLSLQESGQFLNESGLFSFNTIYPFETNEILHKKLSSTENILKSKKYKWKIVSHVTINELNEVPGRLLFSLLKIYLVVIIFVFIISLTVANFKLKNEQAKETEKLLSAAVEASMNAILITDKHGTIEYVNPYFTKATGYTNTEVIGKSPRILKSNNHPNEFYQNLWKTILSGEIWRGEILNKKKNGDLFWENTSISPIKDLKGGINNFVAVKEDITSEKESQEKLQVLQGKLTEQNSKLEEQVKEQLAEIKKKDLLSRYLSPQIVQSVVSGTNDISFNSVERKNITIFFSDIRGFTSLSESMEPEETISLLNNYLEEMTKIIFKHNGTLDKFLGDGIMVLFGAPVSMEDHAKRAVIMAVEMQERLAILQKKWISEGHKALSAGIGINTGFATTGNIGSENLMDYTAVGTQVNLASRLTGLAKSNDIIISHSTYGITSEIIESEEVGEETVKGISHPVKIYRVIGLKENA